MKWIRRKPSFFLILRGCNAPQIGVVTGYSPLEGVMETRKAVEVRGRPSPTTEYENL